MAALLEGFCPVCNRPEFDNKRHEHHDTVCFHSKRIVRRHIMKKPAVVKEAVKPPPDKKISLDSILRFLSGGRFDGTEKEK